MSVNDFLGFALSSVSSKVFEQGILYCSKPFLITIDNQFGLKKRLSGSHAIYTVRNFVDSFISDGSTVNIYAID